MRQANLSICRRNSTQAALSVADIVLLGSSPEVLLRVLEKGQRIVHGLLDVLKLNLVQVFYLGTLIVAIQLLSSGYPYASVQGSVITVATVALPAIGLTFWARAGRAPGMGYGRLLARFVVPAGSTMALAGLSVYLTFFYRSASVPYAQLAVTYTLIYCGLLLAVFLQPPWRKRLVFGVPRMDFRMSALALVLGVVASLLPAIRPAQKLLMMDWLSRPADYAIVGVVVVAWAVIFGFIHWLLERSSAAPERDAVRSG
jgi:magnesium-transporting ATPase (P-type)